MTTAVEIEKPQADVATQPREAEMSLLEMERQDIHKAIDTLAEESILRLSHYIEFLRYEGEIEALEDAEDIAYIESLTPEDRANAVPFEEVIKDYEAKYGPLYQD